MGAVNCCQSSETVAKDGQVDMGSLSSKPSPKQNYSSIRSQVEEDTKKMFEPKVATPKQDEPKKEENPGLKRKQTFEEFKQVVKAQQETASNLPSQQNAKPETEDLDQLNKGTPENTTKLVEE